ncbi:MAG: ABC transporter permease subunit, partial [Chloroflexi bacterium]|nr:ABC transporter permease subunit [Chloroflexota bacterium]
MKNRDPVTRSSTMMDLFRDERFQRVLGQVLFVIFIAGGIYYLVNNMQANMDRQGLALNFSFFQSTAGFDIGEHLISYSRTSTFARAFLVGALNTLLVSALGILFSTILGVIFGVARLSSNYLVRKIAQVYIEFLRNIPLLVLLIFLYIGVVIQFPQVREAIVLPGPVYLSNRGVVVPRLMPAAGFQSYLWVLAVALVCSAALGAWLKYRSRHTGRAPLTFLWGALAFIAIAGIGWSLMPAPPLAVERPELQGLRFVGGVQSSPEFLGLLFGLTIYTSAFIADVVRAGIQSVSLGQLEAARSLGLSSFLT